MHQLDKLLTQIFWFSNFILQVMGSHGWFLRRRLTWSQLQEFLNKQLVFLTYSSQCLHTPFFSCQQSVFFFLIFSWPSTQLTSCFLSVFFFTDKNWFLKPFLLCCCWTSREVTYSWCVLFPAPPIQWETLDQESGVQAPSSGVALVLGSALSELHFYTNDVARSNQGSS